MANNHAPPDVIVSDDTRRNLVVGAAYVPFGVILLLTSAFLRWCDQQRTPKVPAAAPDQPTDVRIPNMRLSRRRSANRLSSDSTGSPRHIVRPGENSTSIPQTPFNGRYTPAPTNFDLHSTKLMCKSQLDTGILNKNSHVLENQTNPPVSPAAEPTDVVSIDMSDVPLNTHHRIASNEQNLVISSNMKNTDNSTKSSKYSFLRLLLNRILSNIKTIWTSTRKSPSEFNSFFTRLRNSPNRNKILLNWAIHILLISMGIQFLLLGCYPLVALFPPLAPTTSSRIKDDDSSLQIDDTVILPYKQILPTGIVVFYMILRLVVMVTAFIGQSVGEAVMVYKFQRLYPSFHSRIIILPIAGICIVLRVVSQIIVNIQLLLNAIRFPMPNLQVFFGAAGCVYFGTMAIIVILLSATFFYKFMGRWRRHVSTSARIAPISDRLKRILAATFYHTVIPAIAALIAAVAFAFSSNSNNAYIAQPIYMAAGIVYKTLFALGIALSIYHMLHDRVRPPTDRRGIFPGMELIDAEPGCDRTLWMTECEDPFDETENQPDILNIWKPSVDFSPVSDVGVFEVTEEVPAHVQDRNHTPRVRLNLNSTVVGRGRNEPSSGASRKTRGSVASSAGPPRLPAQTYAAFTRMFTSIGGGETATAIGGMSVGEATGAVGATSLIEQEQIISLSMVLAGRNSPDEVIKTFLKYARDYVSPVVDFYPSENLRQRDPALPVGAFRAFREVRCTVATINTAPEGASGSVRITSGANSERERTQMMYMPVFFRAQRLGVVGFGPWVPSGSTVTSKIAGTLPEGPSTEFSETRSCSISSVSF